MEKEVKPKYGIGDKVKVVKYGSAWHIPKENYPQYAQHSKKRNIDMWIKIVFGEKADTPLPELIIDDKPDHIVSENDSYWTVDMSPDIVGQEGLICKAEVVQNSPHYAIEGIKGKHAWYHEDQLELVAKNPNNLLSL